MEGYLDKGMRSPMAQGRSTKVISLIEWIRTSRLPTSSPSPAPSRCRALHNTRVKRLRCKAAQGLDQSRFRAIPSALYMQSTGSSWFHPKSHFPM